MDKVAIIAAAGWKGAGVERGLPHCPESFLPLGDGTTPLSRSAVMLTHHGFDVYIVLAKRGYPYNKYWRHSIFGSYFDELSPPKKGPDGFSMDDSPWTQTQYDYASQLGTVIEVPNPGRVSSNETLYFAINTLEDQYEQLFLGRGDMLLSFNFFKKIMTELSWPSMYAFKPGHACFLLDRKSAAVYCELVEPWIQGKWESPRDLEHREMGKRVPDGHPEGTGAMMEAGIMVYGQHNCTWSNKTWMDIDIPEQYEQALRQVADGTLAWPERMR